MPYSHSHNAGYYRLFFVFALVFASSALPLRGLVFVGFSATIFDVENSKYYKLLDYVCILSYPTCNAYAQFSHMEPLLM